MKRIIAFIITVSLLIWMTGCATLPKNLNNSPSSSSSASESTNSNSKSLEKLPFTLGYSKSDTINPFAIKTRNNLELCTLLYEGLTLLDDKLTPKMNLAASVNSTSPNALTAVLRSDARFSDGTAIKASDVTSSFKLAKSSDNYKVLLSNIQAASAGGGNTIIFTLASADPNALACLSFPIIKSGTESSPIGSGRYVFSGGDSPSLNANTHHANKPQISCIQLLDLPDSNSNNLENRSISYFFSDLADGKIPRTSNTSIHVLLNYMVFLGINSSRTGLSDAKIRQALSIAISRKEICSNAFAGRAQAALCPFNPMWSTVSEIKGFDANENTAVAVAQLEQAGYNNTSGNSLSLEMLVSKGNSFKETTAQLLKQQLAKAGITLNITALTNENYSERLKSGDFDLYLGEIRLPANMSLSALLTQGGNASFGINMECTAAKTYSQYLNGSVSIQQFTDTFVSDIPFIPLCWRAGMAAYNCALSNVTPSAFDAYYGIEKWDYS